jgi:amino acid adenylation domain-containing protein
MAKRVSMSTMSLDKLAALPPEKRKLLMARLRAQRGAPAAGPQALPRVEGAPNEFPASFAQQRMWVLDRMDPGKAVYNVPYFARLSGPLDAAALEHALDGVRRRHETLRTTFAEREGTVLQVVHPFVPVPLRVVDLSGLPPEERDAEAWRMAHEDANSGFDLERGPLLRAGLVRLEAGEHLLMMCMHHIVSDGWSLGVLVREMNDLYDAFRQGRTDPLPPLELQYGDFAAWQRGHLQGETLEAQAAFWRDALQGAPPALELPSDRPRPARASNRGDHLTLTLPAELGVRLRALAAREGATLFSVLLAAWRAVLGRHAGQDDVVVGTAVAGRSRRELEPLIGFFVNTIPLRTGLEGDPSFGELVRREKETLLEALGHQDLPFERIVEALRLPRDLSRNPIFQVDFGLQNMPGRAPSLGEAALTEVSVGYDAAKFDLSLSCAEDGQEVSVLVEWAVDLFDRQTAERLAAHWRLVLEQAAAAPDRRLSELAWMDEDERCRVLEWSRGAPLAPAVGMEAELRALPLHRQVEAWARRTPDAPAVIAADASLSYAELDARANRLAHRLRRMGVGGERRVAVMLERSAALVVAELAVMKAGGAYMPLDPAGPTGRAASMLRAAGAAVVLTRAGVRGGVPELGIPIVALDEEEPALASESSDPPGVPVEMEALAYVIFTSGSTGVPKGVAVPHGGAANLVAWLREGYGVGPGTRTLLWISPTFDPSVMETWGTLAAGAALHVVPEALRADPRGLLELMDAQGIHHCVLATPAAEAVMDALDRGAPRPRDLRAMLVGGEALRRRPPPGLPLANLYGPTENSVVSTAAVVAPEGPAAPPIGRPLPGHRAYVLDGHLRLVPQQAAGELYVAGEGLARGYLGQPALTAERFRPDPFAPAGARMYATGDRVRWLPNGELEYLGRADTQVKLRGYRIEVGEIEAALLAHPAVAEAAVVARQEGAGRLVAYLAAARGAKAPSAAELGEHLRSRVPDYMVPAAFVVMEALPLSPSGKVDRRALPDPPASSAAARPQTGAERRIVRVWEELLGIEGVGVDDNFFEIGGHSMLVARMQERLAAELGREVTIVELFQFPTVASLAVHLDARGDASAPSPSPAPAEGAERGTSRRDMMRRQRAR